MKKLLLSSVLFLGLPSLSLASCEGSARMLYHLALANAPEYVIDTAIKFAEPAYKEAGIDTINIKKMMLLIYADYGEWLSFNGKFGGINIDVSIENLCDNDFVEWPDDD